MIQKIVAVLILTLSVLYVARRSVNALAPKKKPCGCSGCGCAGNKGQPR